MELNDQVTVKLTEAGAELLNRHNTTLKQSYPTLKLKTKYKAGEIYKAQLWSIFNDFGGDCFCGGTVVFTNLELSK